MGREGRSHGAGGGGDGAARGGGGVGRGADTVGNTQGMHNAGLRGNTKQGMGIFFRMPRCLGRHFLYLFANSAIVREKLLRVGFMSFAELEVTSRMDGDGDEDAHMVICGYRIGECPAWVGEGISFGRHMWAGEYPEWERHAVLRFRSSGGRVGENISRGVLQEHHDLTEKLWREFHSAARQLPFSGSDADSSDSGEAPPYHLSPLLAFPAGTPFSRFIPRTRSSINTLDSYLSPPKPYFSAASGGGSGETSPLFDSLS